ncbi:MAG: formate--tetrahydrofolate ligase [bacterium]
MINMTDLEISQKAKILPITDIAKKINVSEDALYCYGKHIAKINVNQLSKEDKNGKVILVTAISPTPAGEGKSTTTIGLADALNCLNKNTIVALREPSFGPVLGMKGGACGGGYAQVIPMEDINLHFTGDIHAITTANNAIAAIVDNHIHQGNELNIDINKIIFKRVMDMNDRVLRNITVGLGSDANGVMRDDHFDISVASEVMAILCLSTDLEDFKNKINKIVIGYSTDNKAITVKDLGCSGAIAVIMKDAIKPNLVQTLEHTPVLIHGGPFANIAHGCNSIIATKTAMKLADYVVTEAGFGADLGAEKFLNIKCNQANINPSAVVIVATIRALKMQGGVEKADLNIENKEALLKGISNLERHIENISKFNLPYVIAINKFNTDTNEEINTLLAWAKENNHEISLSEVFNEGSKGAIDLANKVLSKINDKTKLKPLYKNEDSIKNKITTICTQIYCAKEVVFTDKVLKQIEDFEKRGWGNLAICMAKTQYSFSDNAKLLGAPNDHTITIKNLKPSIGAGFIVCLTSAIMTMPGLPKTPAALNMDIIDNKIKGLF